MASSSVLPGRLPSRLVVVAGTYDGVLAGWDTVVHDHPNTEDKSNGDARKSRSSSDGDYLKMSFAMATHEGSVRCLSVASAHGPPAKSLSGKEEEDKGDEGKSKKRKRKKKNKLLNNGEEGENDRSSPVEPGAMLSGGYDESIRVFNLHKHAEAGEFRTPSNLGTPTCSTFAPPSFSQSPSTHALVGLTSGKILVYRKKDWLVQHVLSGHPEDKGGVGCIAVHPTGRMALSGGRGDGRIVLWDLTKGRLAFVHKLPPLGGAGTSGRKRMAGRDFEIGDITWSNDGNRYAFCRGNRVTARDVTTGEDLLDVDLPSRANQIAFVGGPEGMFLAVACDDGSLPVLGVGNMGDENGEEEDTRRAIMAIEPVDRLVAGEERFKCIKAVEGGSGFLVVTANSGGVISLMDLEGAARMMLVDDNDPTDRDEEDKEQKSTRRRASESDEDYSSEEEDEDEDEDVAVEILESVQVGSGARITNIAVWSYDDPSSTSTDLVHDNDMDALQGDTSEEDESEENEDNDKNTEQENHTILKKVPAGGRGNEIEMDAEALARARDLVSQAKKRQKKKRKKKMK